MKVLQVNCVYGSGSTGKITSVLHHELLDNRIDSLVCYGRGSDCSEDGVYKISNEFFAKYNHLMSKFTGIMYGGCSISTKRLINFIEKVKPDVVHLQCINGYFVNIYRLLDYLKKNNIPTVLTLHAEFMFTGGCGYSLKCEQWRDNPGCGNCPIWKQETGAVFKDRTRKMWEHMYWAFQDFENLTVVSVSPWLMNRAKESSILNNKKHCVIYNGLDTSVFHPYTHEINNQKVIFHASPNFNDDPNHMKGGYYVLELAKRMHGIQFVVAGAYSVQGEIPQNVQMLGRITKQEDLARCYSAADLTLLTSKRETFSMVCAESLCCGTPIVGFKAGAPEQISIPDYSEFVDYGDLDALEDAVRKSLSHKKDECIADKSKSLYAKNVMVRRYIDIYKSMI